jgi:plasmid stabilization system protein ParE
LKKAQQWWLENRDLAPDALGEDIQAAFGLVAKQPEIGAKVLNAKLADVRRLHLGRIRYFLYYRLKGDDLIVLAFWHARRGRGPSV